jgi:photosystem II stability/assembly factor-like uncharacterized protein
LGPPIVASGHGWLADAHTGWLIGSRCVDYRSESTDPTDGSDPSRRCQGVIEKALDDGQTWHQPYLGDVQVDQIQFLGRQDGWAVGPAGTLCSQTRCSSALLRTTDGGQYWHNVAMTSLQRVTIAFTTAHDGWLIGASCSDEGTSQTGCVERLLATTDGGQSWRVLPLPTPPARFSNRRVASLAPPTTADGYVAFDFPAPNQVSLFITHDGGQIWQARPSPASPVFTFWQMVSFRTAREG